MRAAPGRTNDVFEIRKVLNEEFFCCLRFLETSAVRHRLTAAGLIKGVDDVHLQLFQKLQSSNSYFWIENVNIAGDHQGDLHGCSPQEDRLKRRSLKMILRSSMHLSQVLHGDSDPCTQPQFQKAKNRCLPASTSV